MTALWIVHDVLIIILGMGGALGGSALTFFMLQRTVLTQQRIDVDRRTAAARAQ